jgi:iron complex outermembrane receptor protein
MIGFCRASFPFAVLVLSAALGLNTRALAEVTPANVTQAGPARSDPPSDVGGHSRPKSPVRGGALTDSNGLKEVVVTATRRAESVQEVPMSISAVSQADLEQAGATQVSDIVRMVPGLAYTENSPGQAILAIRGIQTSAVFGNLQQAVALYYDNVPVLDLTIPWTVPRLQLFDVKRVEVLRGPQGTLFGAGALSGAIRVITNKPDESAFHAATEDSLTTTNGGGLGGTANVMVNVPLIQDKLAMRAVGYYDYTPGWINNPTLGDSHTNQAEVYGGRLELKWTPAQNLELMATAASEVSNPHDSAYVPYGSSSDTANFRVRNFDTDNDKIFNLGATYTMPWATLTSSTSYIDRKATSSLDFSGYANLLTSLTPASPLIDNFNTNNFIQEVRLASSKEHPFKWLIGVFYENYHFDDHEMITQDGVSGLGYPTNDLENDRITTKNTDYAGFGELSYDLTSRLTLTVGARLSRYSITTGTAFGLNGETMFDGAPHILQQSASDGATTPKVSLSYKPNREIMLYALADKGFRTGNVNLETTDPFTGQKLPTSYGPDSLWNYELGVKSTLLNRRLEIDADIYYIDWRKIQLQVRTASDIPYTANAGAAKSKGAEIQIVGRPSRATEIGTSLSLNDANLTSVNPGVPDAKVGDQLPGSAHFTAYAYGQYNLAVSKEANLLFRLDYSYTGNEYSDLGNRDNPSALTYGGYSLVGARVTYVAGNYELGMYVDNLADNRGRVAARNYFLTTVEVRQTPRAIGIVFREWL